MASMLDVTKFFDRESLSDITIKFGEREVKCHKLVLFSASEYFETMLGAKSAFKERNQRVIELKDDDPDALEAMPAFIYTFDYNERFKDKQNDAAFHLSVLTVAKKYLLPKLEKKALDAFASAVPRLNDDVDAAWALIQQHAECPEHTAYVDGVVAALKTKHLSRLAGKPEFYEKLAHDSDLRQLIRNKIELAEWAEGLNKVLLLTCKRCSSAYYHPTYTYRLCPRCDVALIASGQPTQNAMVTHYWMKKT